LVRLFLASVYVMTAQKELEIKLEVAPSTLRRLKGIPLIKALNEPPKRATEVSVYFDTDKQKLRKNGLMLRVRRIGKRHLQTIKAPGNSGPIERTEWRSKQLNDPIISLGVFPRR
jgi:inorganic triphosphatase YgiF